MQVVPQLGSHGEFPVLSNAITVPEFKELCVDVGYEHANQSDTIWTNEMVSSPKTLLYTDVLHTSVAQATEFFRQQNQMVGLLSESEMHSSLFISYGGLDSDFADPINTYLNLHGVETWYFPKDALPGQKLHRAMSTGIMKYDRVLLICSESSLVRAGVLNELERVLEREAKEGGSDILIPVAIDDFVFSKWKPEREDIASQIRSRVITTIPNNDPSTVKFQEEMKKLLAALKKHK